MGNKKNVEPQNKKEI
ncbi:hypothetical protein Bhyg_08584 [Pseudolycoriella hygida]|uniref:Uncharacterized protein n=1 Tax=Pseudolycoriella hygida TaxID=35572 RepID=A0A9Q0N508_9DIPT|nr:hypothetical protein Bhyg_08584 [Pseudolycoriella hygida]